MGVIREFPQVIRFFVGYCQCKKCLAPTQGIFIGDRSRKIDAQESRSVAGNKGIIN